MLMTSSGFIQFTHGAHAPTTNESHFTFTTAVTKLENSSVRASKTRRRQALYTPLLINACEKSSSCPCISRTTYLTMNTFCWLSTNYSALNGGKYSGNSRVLTKAQAMQSKVPRNSVRNAGSLCASPLSQARCSVALLATYIISSAFSFSAYLGVV